MTALHPATELRIALEVAARTAMQYAATDDQIRTIVALARGSNDFNILAGGRLTRMDANRIIDHMIANGAEPEFRKSPEEIEAERAMAETAARNAASKKIAKSQHKDRKAAKDAAEAAKGAALIGQRVHNRYQKIAGTVLSQNGNRVTVQFDGEDSTRIVAVAFVTPGELPA